MRWCLFQEQYRFIFDALLASYLTGNTTYDAAVFRRHLTALKAKEEGATKTDLEKQFEVKFEK